MINGQSIADPRNIIIITKENGPCIVDNIAIYLCQCLNYNYCTSGYIGRVRASFVQTFIAL